MGGFLIIINPKTGDIRFSDLLDVVTVMIILNPLFLCRNLIWVCNLLDFITGWSFSQDSYRIWYPLYWPFFTKHTLAFSGPYNRLSLYIENWDESRTELPTTAVAVTNGAMTMEGGEEEDELNRVNECGAVGRGHGQACKVKYRLREFISCFCCMQTSHATLKADSQGSSGA